jgi:predicted O-methyltransferase YrrM
MKAALLARVLFTDTKEFKSRILTSLEYQMDRFRRPAAIQQMTPEGFLGTISGATGAALHTFLEEESLTEIKGWIAEQSARSAEGFHNATIPLASLCYAVCRAKKPNVVVETGVGNGVTTSFILSALAANGSGELWSIDLPPLGSTGSGCFVAEKLKSRWHLINGRTRERLPDLVSSLESIDVFVHDSLHTYRNMRFEFDAVWPALKRGGVIISDDIAMNRAFEDFFGSKGTFHARCDNFGAAVAI